MTNQEIQRTMEFILEQQAQFATNIQRLQEVRISDNSRLIRLEEAFQVVVRLAENTDGRLDRLEASTGVLRTKMDQLAAAQSHADERLTALIDIVRQNRNDKP